MKEEGAFSFVMVVVMLISCAEQTLAAESKNLAGPPTITLTPLRAGQKSTMCCLAPIVDNVEPSMTLTFQYNDDKSPHRGIPIRMMDGKVELCFTITARLEHHHTVSTCNTRYPFKSGRRLFQSRVTLYAFTLTSPVLSGPTTVHFGDNGTWECHVDDVTFDKRADFSLTWRLDGRLQNTETTSATLKGYIMGGITRQKRYSYRSRLVLRAEGHRNVSKKLTCVIWHQGLQVSVVEDERTLSASMDVLFLGSSLPDEPSSSSSGKNDSSGTSPGHDASPGKSDNHAVTSTTPVASTLTFSGSVGKASNLKKLLMAVGASAAAGLVVMGGLCFICGRHSKKATKDKKMLQATVPGKRDSRPFSAGVTSQYMAPGSTKRESLVSEVSSGWVPEGTSQYSTGGDLTRDYTSGVTSSVAETATSSYVTSSVAESRF